MKSKIVFLLVIAVLFGIFQPFEFYSARKIITAVPPKKIFQAEIIDKNDSFKKTNLSKIKERINNKKSKEISALAENDNYLAYLPNQKVNQDFIKISVAKEELNGSTFKEWMDVHGKGDEVSQIIATIPVEFNDHEAVIQRYIVNLHGEFKLSVIYINFQDYILSMGIYGNTHKTFEELEVELERFANEL